MEKAVANTEGGASRLNVLIFITDQQRADTTFGEGVHRAKTPRLDAFRAEGARTFERATAPAPHCSPSRASFFSGVYPSQHGVWNNVGVTNALSRGPRSSTPFWSVDFAEAGYELAFTGKWHVSDSEEPETFGWRHLQSGSYVKSASLDPEQQRASARARELAHLEAAVPAVGDVRADGEIIRAGYPQYFLYGTSPDRFGDIATVDRGVEFVGEERARPWLLYVGTLGPHDPYFVPQEFLDQYTLDDVELPENFDDAMHDKPNLYRRTRERFDRLARDEHREALRHYLAFCTFQDHLFGRLLDELERTGQRENTIVLYTSDHGDYAAEHGLWTKGLPAFSGAYHVPMHIHVPHEVGATSVDSPVSLCDVGPSLLNLCGVQASHERAGLDMWNAPKDRDVFHQSNGNELYGIQRVIVSGRYKLVVNLFDFDELYDHQEDPGEVTNLLGPSNAAVGNAGRHVLPAELEGIVTDLYRRLWQFSLSHDDDIINDYIMTALASLGPIGLDALAESADSQRLLASS